MAVFLEDEAYTNSEGGNKLGQSRVYHPANSSLLSIQIAFSDV